LALVARGNRPPPSEQDLQDYVDGRLEAGQQAEIAAYLADHPATAARIERYRAHVAGMHALYDTEPIPPRMQALLQRAARRRRRPLLAVAAAGMVGAAMIVIAVLSGGASVAGEVAAAQAAHLHFTAASFAESDVAELRNDSLERVLGERLSAPVSLPDAAGAGFTLTAVRLLPAPHQAALLLYRDRANHAASLYVAAGDGGDERGDRVAAGVRTFFHSARGVFYALTVSAAEPDEMVQRVSAMTP
jgi:anti-sigma factor RsiW